MAFFHISDVDAEVKEKIENEGAAWWDNNTLGFDLQYQKDRGEYRAYSIYKYTGEDDW